MTISPVPPADVVFASGWPVPWQVPVVVAIMFATASGIGFVNLMRARRKNTPKQQAKALQRYRDEPRKKAERERKQEARRKKRLGLSEEGDKLDRYWDTD